MAKKKSRFGIVALVAFAVIVVATILVVVGYTLDWIKSTTLTAIETKIKLSDLVKNNSNPSDALAAMNAFAIITLIASLASAGCYVVSTVLGIKLFKLITALVGVVTLICAVVLIITTFSYCSKGNFSLGSLSINEATPAVGPWLMTIGGVICGAATAVGAMKK